MAANKFATMLHKNTNRITLILVYVLLEWILIVLLLLNSLFSYLIVKFADYFGLKRPCLWCSSLDHVFEPSKYQNSYRDLVCDDHANEISRLGFCANHRRLSESGDMCGDCLSSTPPDVMGNGDENLKCCCCGNPRKGNLISEAEDGIRSDFMADDQEDEQKIQEEKDLILPMEANHLEFYLERDDFQLIPVKLMDFDAERSQKIYKFREEDQGVSDNGDVFDFDLLRRPPVELAVENSCSSAENTTPLCSHETKIENETSVAELAVVESMESNEEEEDDVQANAAIREGETNVDSTNQGGSQDAAVETSEQEVKKHVPLSSDLYEIEEDKVPDTPTSVDGFQLLQKKLLLFKRRELETEDSFDGSVFSDIESADGVLTVEKLKSALKTERKALNALYRELEEERNASEVAASQTMAMINRLQEEKAAMQMEGLQYQRMMEEQSEYDQEALQLLNELMVKRETEKAELEKELEIYRRKVLDYEAKDTTVTIRRKGDSTSTSSASSSNAEDSDGVSVDLNHESKEEDGIKNHQIREDVNPNTPADTILYLEESLASVEEERLSILEQLKVLEQKLVSLNDEEEEQQHFKYFCEENGNSNGFHERPDSGHETNGVANDHFKGVNGNHQEDKIVPMAAKAKRLLPFFDATDADIEDKISKGHENGFHSLASQHSSPELEIKKLDIEEEADHVYQRLQELNADREFIKHCISSLKKGDKGVYLLQEILQHLHDLRSIELRVRSIKDAAT